jgi:hypothetical protein
MQGRRSCNVVGKCVLVLACREAIRCVRVERLECAWPQQM